LIQVKSLDPNHHIVENVLVTIARPVAHRIDGRTLSLLRFCQGTGCTKGAPGRHMRHGKSVDWHIDQLTERGIIIGSWIVPNGRQCELVAIYADPGFRQ
jgi:hypothetical protein